MISGMRDHALALACIRNGLPSVHGRGIDQLPSGVEAQFRDSLVRGLDRDELSRAFQVVTLRLLNEIENVDQALAARLQEALIGLSDPTL